MARINAFQRGKMKTEDETSVKAMGSEKEPHHIIHDHQNYAEMVKKFEVLREKQENLKTRQTQINTLIKRAKEDEAKIAKEIEDTLGLSSPEELDEWIEKMKVEQEKTLKEFEENLLEAEEKIQAIENIINEERV